VAVDPVVEDLATELQELGGLLETLSEPQWSSPTRCEGWDVSDVVIHLAQTNEMAIGSAQGRYAEVLAGMAEGLQTEGTQGPGSVDQGVALMVARERGVTTAELLARWSQTATRMVDALDSMDLSKRVVWVTGELSARSMATTRLAETWIHGGDIASAVGSPQVPTDRLRHISRLAWRTLPYAFTTAGRTMTGPVAFRLTSPSGESWDLLPEEPAATTISGPASDLCDVASRRLEASQTTLVGEGPDAEDVLALVRTYA
jgi:uncharacterized protein (TIGR03084 family)